MTVAGAAAVSGLVIALDTPATTGAARCCSKRRLFMGGITIMSFETRYPESFYGYESSRTGGFSGGGRAAAGRGKPGHVRSYRSRRVRRMDGVSPAHRRAQRHAA